MRECALRLNQSELLTRRLTIDESQLKFGNDVRKKICRAANVVNKKPQDHHKISQTHLRVTSGSIMTGRCELIEPPCRRDTTPSSSSLRGLFREWNRVLPHRAALRDSVGSADPALPRAQAWGKRFF